MAVSTIQRTESFQVFQILQIGPSADLASSIRELLAARRPIFAELTGEIIRLFLFPWHCRDYFARAISRKSFLEFSMLKHFLPSAARSYWHFGCTIGSEKRIAVRLCVDRRETRHVRRDHYEYDDHFTDIGLQRVAR